MLAVAVFFLGCADAAMPVPGDDGEWTYAFDAAPAEPTLIGSMTLAVDGGKIAGVLRAPDSYPAGATWDMAIRGESKSSLELLTAGIPSWSLTCDATLPGRLTCTSLQITDGRGGAFLAVKAP